MQEALLWNLGVNVRRMAWEWRKVGEVFHGWNEANVEEKTRLPLFANDPK